MHRESRQGEVFPDVASISPSFTTFAHTARPVVPIYFPGRLERTAIWFTRTRLRRSIQILVLVVIFGAAGGITGGILATVNYLAQHDAQNDQLVVAEETSQDVEPMFDAVIKVPMPQARVRRRPIARPRLQPQLIAVYGPLDFKQGKRAKHSDDDEEN